MWSTRLLCAFAVLACLLALASCAKPKPSQRALRDATATTATTAATATTATAAATATASSSSSCDGCIPCELRGYYEGVWLGDGAEWMQSAGVTLNFTFDASAVIGGLFFANGTMLSPVVARAQRMRTLASGEYQIIFYYSAVLGMPSDEVSPIQCRFAAFSKQSDNKWVYEESGSHVYVRTEELATLIASPSSFAHCPAGLTQKGGPLMHVEQVYNNMNKYPDCASAAVNINQ
eukprot:TRINITY_DN2447_c1_g1_i1.p1 TRINITY_DN2447_c1_g1~~TRINITY_DN2447_c1_g1_i1.p1  ORF type:complete len:234 (+),score=74.94 TRINITY_DN2447_c1_g1_i1:288-989(+)